MASLCVVTNPFGLDGLQLPSPAMPHTKEPLFPSILPSTSSWSCQSGLILTCLFRDDIVMS
jgi:hypothetical protein